MNIKTEILKIIDQHFESANAKPELPLLATTQPEAPPSAAPQSPSSDLPILPSSHLKAASSHLARRSRRSPTGKIARLPRAIRERVSQMIDDGLPLQQIANQLATVGFPGINHTNLSNWKARGYRDWLASRQPLAAPNDPLPVSTAIHNLFQLADSLFPGSHSCAATVVPNSNPSFDGGLGRAASEEHLARPTQIDVELAKANLFAHLALAGHFALALECGGLR